MPRLVNAPQFEIDDLQGKMVDRLIGCADIYATEEFQILIFRVSGDDLWHRLFLDAGIGFWEKWSEEEAFEDFSDCRQIDLTALWNLSGSKIQSVECLGTDLNDPKCSEFQIVLEKGTLTIRYADENDMESDTIINWEEGIQT